MTFIEAVVTFFQKNGFAFEMLLCNFMFVRTLKKRSHFVWRAVGGFAVFLGVTIGWSFFDTRYTYWDIPKFTLLVVLATFIVQFCFKVKLRTALFCEISAFATQHCAYKIGELSESAFVVGLGVENSMWMYVAILPVVYTLFYFLFARRLKKYDVVQFDNREIILLSVALMLISIVLGQYDYHEPGNDYIIYLMLAFYDIICCFFTLSVQYAILRSASMRQEVQLMENMLYQQKKQLAASKETIDTINIKCHDLKHQLSRLEGRVSDEELNELKEAITIYDLSVKTGNDVLDVILAEKSLKCWRNNIKLNCIADGSCLAFMRSTDIYSLFGNAVDNAIDAVQKLSDTGRRVIGVSVKRTMDMVALHFENSYDGTITFSDDLPVTTKKDKRYHGFGMKSIRLLTEKYDGVLSVNTADNLFRLNILLPYCEKKA